MPIVIVETWAGKTDEQKARLIKGITKAFEGIGVRPEEVVIVIHDVPKNSWGMRGEPASEQTQKHP